MKKFLLLSLTALIAVVSIVINPRREVIRLEKKFQKEAEMRKANMKRDSTLGALVGKEKNKFLSKVVKIDNKRVMEFTERLIEINGLRYPYIIKPDELILIPFDEYDNHNINPDLMFDEVRQKDSVWKIAERYLYPGI